MGNFDSGTAKVHEIDGNKKGTFFGVLAVIAFVGVCALLVTGAHKMAVVLAVVVAIAAFSMFCYCHDLFEVMEDLGRQMLASKTGAGSANLRPALKMRAALRVFMGSTLFFLVMLILFGCGELVPLYSIQWSVACALTAALCVEIDTACSNIKCKFVESKETN